MHRVQVQRKALREELDEIVLSAIHHRAIMVVDWKMKFEQIWFRETMPRWYGRNGISWNWAAVYLLPKNVDPGEVTSAELEMLF